MTLTPKAILVPTDFSPASDNALDLARELAGTFDAEIHLLHVCTIFDGPIVSPEDLDKVERVLAMSDAKTLQALEASVQEINAPTHCHVHRGAGPADAIIKAVTEHNCDLVIMGTNGRRGMKGLIVGSVAKEVVHRSPVPVLTTRAETASTFPPKKILVAYDSSEDSLQAVLLAADWAPLLSAEITLLHAMEPVTYPDFYAQYTPREDQLKRLSERCHNALVEVGSEHLNTVAHETAVIHAQAADGIADFAETESFDLVILATRGLSGISHVLFGSVAERVTQLSKIPVLTVREPPQSKTSPSKKEGRKRKFTAFPRRIRSNSNFSETISVERSQDRTILRFLAPESHTEINLRLLDGLWDFFKDESCDPPKIVVILAPPDLLATAGLEQRLVRPFNGMNSTAAKLRAQIIREENVIQRFIQGVRGLNSFVVGAIGGNIALPLAAPLLACDYRIVSPESTFVNTNQTVPQAPLGCVPWLLAKMVGEAKACQLLLDVPELSADDALELGLVSHVTAADRLEEEALEVADRLGTLPRATLVGLKRAMTASNKDFRSYLDLELALAEQLAWTHWAE